MTITVSGKPRRPAEAVPSVGVHRTVKHLYYFNGQGPWPGVTTVTDVLDKPALVNWKREQVARSAVEFAERLLADRKAGNEDAAVAFLMATRNSGTDARERGTRIHSALEHILRREPYVAQVEDEPAINGARSWLNGRSIEPLEIEAFLINEEEGFGGTCDLIARIDGETWLLDWKSSKSVAWPDGRVYGDYKLQLAAYANAGFIARMADETRHPLPKIERFGILHVTDGGTRLYPADVTDADWQAFRACLRLTSWKKTA